MTPTENDIVVQFDPSGTASACTTYERHFTSIHEALDAARQYRASSDGVAAVRIQLSPGRHVMRKTLSLGEVDSGTESCPFVIEGDPEHETVLSAGCRLDGFVPVADPAVTERLPAESRARVWACDLRKNGVTEGWGELTPRFGCGGAPATIRSDWPEVYYNGSPLSLTRWPLDDYAHIGDVLQGKHTTNSKRYESVGVFNVAETIDLRKWQYSFEAGDVWTSGMWGWLWNCSILPIEQVDYATGTIHHALSAPFGLRPGKPFYFVNMLEELKCPGQYYVDRKAGMLYLIPPDGEPAPGEAVVEVTLASGPFIRISDASHIAVRNLTFEYNQGDALAVEGGEAITLEQCEIRRLGGNALVVRGGKNHRVLHCDMHTLGAGGIELTSGARETLVDGNCLIENCRIHDFARINRAYAPAVSLAGCGNTIRHCEIFDSPHHAVRVEGDNHVVELCSFHHLVLEFDDQAPLEMFGNPYYRGIIFRWNRFHHVGGGQTQEGQAGIRLDDYISAVEIYGNVFYGVGRGTFGAVQIHGGKDTRVKGNLFIDCQAMVSFSPWGEERWLKSLASWELGNKDEELTDIRVAAFPELLDVASNYDRNYISGNVALGCTSLTLDDGGRNVCENNVTRDTCPDWPRDEGGLPRVDFTDPVFKEQPFAPIPVKEIGCYDLPKGDLCR